VAEVEGVAEESFGTPNAGLSEVLAEGDVWLPAEVEEDAGAAWVAAGCAAAGAVAAGEAVEVAGGVDGVDWDDGCWAYELTAKTTRAASRAGRPRQVRGRMGFLLMGCASCDWTQLITSLDVVCTLLVSRARACPAKRKCHEERWCGTATIAIRRYPPPPYLSPKVTETKGKVWVLGTPEVRVPGIYQVRSGYPFGHDAGAHFGQPQLYTGCQGVNGTS